jgi:hypothetical protein
MAEESPELQAALRDLDRDLEVGIVLTAAHCEDALTCWVP